MENQNRKFRPPILSIILGIGGEDELAVCQCPLHDWCTCRGTPVCRCFGDHTEAEDTNAVDAVEHSERVVAKQSNDIVTHSSNVIEGHDEAMTSTAPALEARLTVGDEARVIENHYCVGKHLVEPTSSVDNWCGMFALEISTDSQLGKPLTQPEFWRIMTCPEMQAFNAMRNWSDITDNFHDEQLAVILRIWGRSFPGLDNLQLGIILGGTEFVFILGNNKFLLVSPGYNMEGERAFRTVWIHNDNAGQRPGCKLNHYSGIRLLGEGSSDTKSSTEEASGDDTEAEEREESPGENSSDTVEAESSKEMGDDMDMEGGDESPWRVLPTS